MNANIKLQDVSLKFRIYKNPTPSLKETFINLVSRRRQADDVIEFFALNHINLDFNGGSRVGIVGLNGAGKSTLLKTIAGIYPPHAGKICIRGSVTPMIELGAGFDFEQPGRENIYLNGAILGISQAEMKRREDAIIDFSELGNFVDMPVKYYSSGMFSRLAFSIAVMADPQILIVDEILSAGDAHFVSKATERMKDLFKNSQIVLLVSHSVKQVADLCNEVVVMNKGEVVARGETDAMLKYYQDEIVNQGNG
jgi:ABC-type polysaccharide/polyol phosphate transport system ATPase subunit